MSQSIGEFRQHLVRSGLMTDEEVGHFLASLPGDKAARDASALARELVSANRLTKYQASAIFQGKTQGLVLGIYVVLDKIGAGGMGQVFKAFDRRMERVVALKMLPAGALAASEAAGQLHVAHVPRIEAQFQAMAAPEAVARLHREARAAARLHHPNIVTVFDADEADGVYFLAMEYLDGHDLASLVKERHPLPVAEVVDYVLQAARGLAYAHSQGIVHRDVKPANLVLDERGVVKILDMGLARFVSQVGDAFDTDTGGLTQTGQVIGTVDFMSPEQAEDMRQADERSDIYSLGCTLYMLLTGRPPYQGETLIKKFLAHREAEIPSIRALRRDVSTAIDGIFMKMMAKKASERFQSLKEIENVLRTLLSRVVIGNLCDAICWRDFELAKSIISMNSSVVNLCDDDGDSPLVLAARGTVWALNGPFECEDVGDDAEEGESFEDWTWRKHNDTCEEFSDICRALFRAGADKEPLHNWLEQINEDIKTDFPTDGQAASEHFDDEPSYFSKVYSGDACGFIESDMAMLAAARSVQTRPGATRASALLRGCRMRHSATFDLNRGSLQSGTKINNHPPRRGQHKGTKLTRP